MPKAIEPSVRVLSYFQDVPLQEAQQSLSAAKYIVSRRLTEAEAASSTAMAGKPVKKPRKPRRAKAGKAEDGVAPAPVRRQPTSLRPSAGQAED